MRGLYLAIACVVMIGVVPRAQNTNVVIQPPMVTGPIALTTALRSPDHGYPYNATPIDLAKQGYIEEEFFLSGEANRYSTPAGERGTVLDTNHSYTTRIVVRRPKAAARFNGTAIVEWYNVSQGHVVRKPERRVSQRKVKIGRHYSDHGVRHAFDAQRTPNDARVAPEIVPPGTRAEDDDSVGPPVLTSRDACPSILCLLGGEAASEHRLHAEDVEQIRGDA